MPWQIMVDRRVQGGKMRGEQGRHERAEGTREGACSRRMLEELEGLPSLVMVNRREKGGERLSLIHI